MEGARDVVAAVQHNDIWAYWMKYVFEKCGTLNEDGSFTIDAQNVTRWKRQIETPYEELSSEEQQSDLRQADKVLNAISHITEEFEQLLEKEAAERRKDQMFLPSVWKRLRREGYTVEQLDRDYDLVHVWR